MNHFVFIFLFYKKFMIYKYLLEIKYRILFCLVAWNFVIINCYYFKEILLYVFIKPSLKFYHNYTPWFLTTNVTEIFSTYIELCLFLANQLIIPFIGYQFFSYFSNGLYTFEYDYFKKILIKLIFCWIFFVFLLNKVIFPVVWFFFFKFQNFTFHFEIKLNEYVSFYKSVYFVCNPIFQFITAFFIFLDLFKTNLLLIKKWKKICYYIFVILATFITPPEVLYQLICSIFTLIIYEFTIISIILNYELIKIK